ncbi:MAG: GAF domain-containing protein [Anaerolineales bacterium]|nr:GAF domain-containing protein [Anaerolineales bacterium]
MSGERVLVTDDSTHMVSFLSERVLPALGYKPLVASTGQQALEIVKEKEPDLILLDFNLPDMTGMDVVHRLAESGNQTPVILMTAYGSEQIAVEAFRLGVRDYLSKPIELDDVAGAIERALQEPRLQKDKRQLADQLHRTNLELRRQVEEVAALTRIGRAITSSLELNQILTMVSSAAIKLCQAEEATIWLLEDDSNDLIMVAEKGVDQEAIRLPRMKVDDWLAGETVRTRKPINRTAERGSGIEIKTGYLVQAVMYVPILIQDRCLGVVSVANRQKPRPFTKDEQKTLQAMADYAAIAIENAKQYQSADDSLQQRLEELAAINEISEAVSTLDLQVLFSRAMNRIQKTFNVDAALFFLVDDTKKTLKLTYSTDDDKNISPRTDIPIGKGIIGNSVFKGTSLLTNEPLEHNLFEPDIDEIASLKIQAILTVPLVLKDRTIGAIELVNKQTGPFTKQDADLLKAMATAIAVAVDNASLYDQVARERATLKAVLEGSANPIVISDQSGAIVLCNPAFQELFNQTSETVRGKTIKELVDAPQLIALVEQGVMVSEEIPYEDKFYLTHIASIPDVGSVIEMQDITHFKDLDRAKTEFVAAVSHDLRAPLAALTGFIELLPEVGEVTDKQREFVTKALRSADRMRELINDLLDLAKIESGMDVASDSCNLFAIAQHVVSGFQDVANGKVKLSLVKQGEIPIIKGNASQLGRALANLVDNAMKYTPSGGHVRVGMQATSKKLFLAVMDSGWGIHKADLPHIFDPFYRGKQYKDEAEGSGLGLTMVKSIIEQHKGTISVRSQIGRGSTFTIVLPVA